MGELRLLYIKKPPNVQKETHFCDFVPKSHSFVPGATQDTKGTSGTEEILFKCG